VTLLAAECCGVADTRRVVAAALIEFIHTATLLHDDVVDGSDRRRGRPTANEAFGNAASVLVGDFLYTRAFEMMVSLDCMPLMQLMAGTTNRIAQGEVMQLTHSFDLDLSESRYFQVIEAKTAVLFAAAAQLGGLLAGVEAGQQQAFYRYGHALGLAFQLIDDVLDYAADPAVWGKSLGDDLAEGKLTLPLIQALRGPRGGEIRALIQPLEQGDALTPEDMQQVRTLLADSGGLEYTRRLAQNHALAAQKALSALPASLARQGLEVLARLAVERAF